MAVRDTKIKLYQQMIFEEENRRAQTQLEKLKGENEEKLARRTRELAAWKEDLVRRRVSAANLRKQELLSAQDQDNIEMLLQKREEIAQDLLQKIIEKARAYVQTNEYRVKFQERLNALIAETDETEFHLQVRDEDKKTVEKLAKESGKTIYTEPLPEEKVGGFVLQDLARSYAVEDTIASRIDQNRYRITKALYQTLEVDDE